MKFDYKTEYQRYKRYYTELTPFLKTPVARAYTMIILSLLSMSVFGFFAIRPTIKTIVGLNKEIKDARYTDKKLQEKINQLSDAQAVFTTVQPDLPVVTAALPSESSFQSLLRQIETATSQSGASISGVQFKEVTLFGEDEKKEVKIATVSSLLSEMPFSITFGGSYKNFSGLLLALRKMERIIGIESIAITSASAAESGSLSINVTAKAFFLP